MMRPFVFILIACIAIQSVKTQDCDNMENFAFQPGEKVIYELSYNWGIPWIKVGLAKFEVKSAELNGKEYYHLVGSGSSYESWDWFYKMRAVHQSYVDPETMKQVYFSRDVKEPDFFIDLEYRFNWSEEVAYSKYESKKHSLRYDTIELDHCTYDLQSILYYARNLDYSDYKEGDKIPITLLLDRKITPLYFRYMGKENVRVKKFGKFRCLKFSIYLVEGTMFHEGENMQLWVTDDKNRVPVKIESPIIVGSIKANLIHWEGLKNPVKAKK